MTAACYSITGGDYEQGGAASRALKEQLKKIGAEPAIVRRAIIAAYEAEMNVVIHARRGTLRFCFENGQVEVEVTDEGPGIADIDQALRPGYSTADAKARDLGFGAGMGLPNIKKNSDTFAIESTPGQGTTVRFAIRLKAPTLYGDGRHSVHVVADECRCCFRCLRVCPTNAVRVFRGRPQLLDYLCVDCAACIAACPTAALQMAGPTTELVATGQTLVLAPAVLAQFGPAVPVERVLYALRAVGFADVVVTAGWETALRAATLEAARHCALPWPVISPACPAAVNLIETRFPSLIPHLARFASPFEAVAAEFRGQPLTCVVSCPCQRTALLASGLEPAPTFVLPKTLHAALAPQLTADGDPATRASSRPVEQAGSDVVSVSGIERVVSVLERIENGLAGDVVAVEPYACEEAGFGSPLLSEDPVLARHRWRAADLPADSRARAVVRSRPYAARRGLRLDADMSRAMQKLGRIDKLRRTLPGDECSLCGAPTCAAFAEDVVLGRAVLEDCPRREPPPEENA